MSISKKVNGQTVTYVVRWRDPAGVQRSKHFDRLKDAELKDADVRRARALGELYVDDKMTFGEAAKQFLADYQAGTASKKRPSEKTMVLARQLNFHLRSLWHVPVKDVSRRMLVGAVSELPARTQEQTSAFAKRVLRHVAAEGRRVRPDALAFRVAKASPRRSAFVSWDAIENVLAPEMWDESSADMIRFAARTGLRASELIGLEERDVDLDGGVIRVRRETSKTDSGARVIPLDPYLARLLKAQLVRRPPVAKALWTKDDTAEAWTYNALRNRFVVVVGRVVAQGHDEFRGFTLHSLRHSFASLLCAANVHPRAASDLLGHGDGGALFLKTYGHLYTDSTRRAMEQLGAHLDDGEEPGAASGSARS